MNGGCLKTENKSSVLPEIAKAIRMSIESWILRYRYCGVSADE
jgi:hypothetical protein